MAVGNLLPHQAIPVPQAVQARLVALAHQAVQARLVTLVLPVPQVPQVSQAAVHLQPLLPHLHR